MKYFIYKLYLDKKFWRDIYLPSTRIPTQGMLLNISDENYIIDNLAWHTWDQAPPADAPLASLYLHKLVENVEAAVLAREPEKVQKIDAESFKPIVRNENTTLLDQTRI